ncbi:MAG: 1-acyl-sn-glycerol-3-phosphate acyltransferase [Clostridia bacterium]|nr:1-acyl-sn-glycerol-3-phosphate acyltransferase [Clostridia bacterium]
MEKNKRNMFVYRLVQFLSWIVSTFIFRRKILRNEVKGQKGPFAIIANHQASLDFVNLIGVTRRPITFVISQSIYRSSPVKWFMTRLGIIPKQQFQTTLKDMRRMKQVIDAGEILAIYPAGLMCEDGRSTPIPAGTYQFLKWLRTDIYVARTSGMYFSMPKWTRGMRAGRTQLDVYRLFSKEELESADLETIKRKTDEVLNFDAYREQETLLVKYKHTACIEGLQNVLYMCPHCKREFSMQVKDKCILYCTECGFAHKSDDYGFLHNVGGVGEEIRYVSDWSRMIHDELKQRMIRGEEETLSASTAIHMVDPQKNKFVPVGQGNVTLSSQGFALDGGIKGEENVHLEIPTVTFASLPFKPGKNFEIQNGNDIYRCVLEDGRLAMKFIHMVKIYYELHDEAHTKS